ncbi:MAG: AAA family ATPase [Saprospiraceae bacterium]
MKIINIRFKNINNLKGEHVIDFSNAPLSTAGIFAIVGPTGSGKSTLLDVITLALFNRIPRYSKVITKKGIHELGSVMTHYMDEANASITYEIKGNQYTSAWSIARARTGNLKEHEMFIYDVSGKPLDLKKSEIPAYNEGIIGLKYDQFIKSIILSQGEFAQFLKADKNERTELLENITGTSIYRELGIAAYQKHKSKKEEIDREREVMGEIQVMDDEERQTLVTNLNHIKKVKGSLDTEAKALTALKNIKEECKIKQKKLDENEVEAKEIKRKITEYKPFITKLTLHDKINPLRTELADYNNAKQMSDKAEVNIENDKASCNASEKKLVEVMASMSQLCNKEVSKDNFKAVMSNFEKEVNVIDRDLKNTSEKGREERNIINRKKASYPVLITDAQQPEEALILLNDRHDKLQLLINKSNLSDSSDVTQTRTLIKQKQEEKSILKDLNHNFEHIAEAQKNLKRDEEKLSEIEVSLKQINPQQIKKEEYIDILKQNLDLLKKQKDDAQLIATLEEHRMTLVDDEPCPLCGSKDHPYTIHLNTELTSEMDIKILETKQKYDHNHKELTDLKESIVLLKSQHKVTLETKTERDKQLQLDKTSNSIFLIKYRGKTTVTDRNVKILLQSISNELLCLEEGVSALDEIKINKELYAGYERLQNIGTTYISLKEKRIKLYSGRDVSEECNALEVKFTTVSNAIIEYKTAIDKEIKNREGAQKLLKSLSSKLQPQIELLGFSTFAEINQNILTEDKVDQFKSKKEDLQKLQIANETMEISLQSDFKGLRLKDTSPDKSLEEVTSKLLEKENDREYHTTKIGELQNRISRDDEDNSKIKSKEKDLEKLNEEMSIWTMMNHLIGSAKGDTFANFSQGLTLQNLLVYTNKRLQNLSDRYLIDRSLDGGTLMVIDLYQGNTQRAVSTLSGGETFLISLALALSLSDMASKNVALECLFIDEGFGTLDPETLDIAMNTLEKMQSESQKMVGVISHVDALKERINIQIRLEKNAQGHSKIIVE